MPYRNDPLDALDYRILELWQANTRVPAKLIADAVGLSTAAVQRRLARLRQTGVIRRETAELDPARVGLPLTCVVHVELERETAADLEQFKRRMRACAEVQQCYYVAGQSDFILVVLTADLQAFEAFSRHNLLDDPNVRSFTTHAALERVKTGSTVALPVD
jgi:Lrp/AsnC family transcriptional regulator, leucine-responsive regulatory protein